MAYLHNENGIDYEIISSRDSRAYKGRKDYIVRNPHSGGIYIVHGWNPKQRAWAHSSYCGSDDLRLESIKDNFKQRGVNNGKKVNIQAKNR